MNKIQELLKELESLGNFGYLSTINSNNIFENECHQFKITEKTDLEDNVYYLSVDKNIKYCYFYFISGVSFNTEMLFDDNGKIIFYNSHSNMANKSVISRVKPITNDKEMVKKDFDFRKIHILNSFKPCDGKYKKTEVIYSKEDICYHFNKFSEKYPIKLECCHTVSKTAWDIIIQEEGSVRTSFNDSNQNCNYIDIKDKASCTFHGNLVKSHLISGNNIRSLNNHKKTTYYGSRFFSELNNRPFSFLQTISEEKRDSKNRNFKIACFCEKCEQLFVKTDKNIFSNINELTDEIIIKAFGVYLQETKCSIETYKSLCENNNVEVQSFAISHFDFKKIEQNRKILLEKFNLYKNKKLMKYEHSSCLPLIDKPFMESVSLSINNGFYYLIYITNKNKKMFFNFITDDPDFKDKPLTKEHLIYAAITLNTYNIYSESFHSTIKNLAGNILFDYFKNDINKDISNPILFPKFNYLTEIKNIISLYIDHSI